MSGQEAPALSHLLKLFSADEDPTEDTLFMWAAMWDKQECLEAGIVILLAGSTSHQYAVASTLRYLGFSVELKRIDGIERWFVDGHNLEE